ncbi:MAG TPA: alpha/beta fold hydrolase [Bacteroidetes bacterium]|nr:alpha/beta fold hydrolase [Bacteroidota bacterium]
MKNAIIPFSALGTIVKGLFDKYKDTIYDVYSGKDETQIVPVRQMEKNRAAILFVHGFGGDAHETWGQFPDFIKDDAALGGWDVYNIAYNTKLFPDIQGIWASNPDVTALAGLFRTLLNNRFSLKYKQVAIAAHSMGGLVTQRAILDLIKLDEDSSFIHSLTLYGTPSNGLRNARFGAKLNKQVKDMASDSEFIKNLRSDWNELIGDKPPFKFLTCAGDLDDFVPPSSSLEPFPEKYQKRVNGNHTAIVKPATPDHISYKVLRHVLLEDVDFFQGKWDSAEVALEMGDFARARKKLEPRKDDLGPQEIVDYAFSLDATGDHEAAMLYLKEQSEKDKTNSDLLGILGGQWKRAYLSDLKKEHLQKSLELYKKAYDIAENNKDPEQIYYHAINLAFLNLKMRKMGETKKYAQIAIDNVNKTRIESFWKYATLGEAYIYLEDEGNAYYNYLIALEKNPGVHEKESMYIQWLSIVQQLGMEGLEGRLRKLFREGV